MNLKTSRTRGRHAALVGLASLPVWWGGYLVLLYPPSPEVYAVGVLVALLTSASVVVEVLVVEFPSPSPRRMLADLPSLPWQVLRGYVRVVRAGLTLSGAPVRGGLHRELEPGVAGDDPGSRGQRAWRGWVGSLAADRIIAGFPERDTVLVHSFPPEHDDEPGGST